jgi:hypothetical protein
MKYLLLFALLYSITATHAQSTRNCVTAYSFKPCATDTTLIPVFVEATPTAPNQIEKRLTLDGHYSFKQVLGIIHNTWFKPGEPYTGRAIVVLYSEKLGYGITLIRFI